LAARGLFDRGVEVGARAFQPGPGLALGGADVGLRALDLLLHEPEQAAGHVVGDHVALLGDDLFVVAGADRERLAALAADARLDRLAHGLALRRELVDGGSELVFEALGLASALLLWAFP